MQLCAIVRELRWVFATGFQWVCMSSSEGNGELSQEEFERRLGEEHESDEMSQEEFEEAVEENKSKKWGLRLMGVALASFLFALLTGIELFIILALFTGITARILSRFA